MKIFNEDARCDRQNLRSLCHLRGHQIIGLYAELLLFRVSPKSQKRFELITHTMVEATTMYQGVKAFDYGWFFHSAKPYLRSNISSIIAIVRSVRDEICDVDYAENGCVNDIRTGLLAFEEDLRKVHKEKGRRLSIEEVAGCLKKFIN